MTRYIIFTRGSSAHGSQAEITDSSLSVCGYQTAGSADEALDRHLAEQGTLAKFADRSVYVVVERAD